MKFGRFFNSTLWTLTFPVPRGLHSWCKLMTSLLTRRCSPSHIFCYSRLYWSIKLWWRGDSRQSSSNTVAMGFKPLQKKFNKKRARNTYLTVDFSALPWSIGLILLEAKTSSPSALTGTIFFDLRNSRSSSFLSTSMDWRALDSESEVCSSVMSVLSDDFLVTTAFVASWKKHNRRIRLSQYQRSQNVNLTLNIWGAWKLRESCCHKKFIIGIESKMSTLEIIWK